MSFEKGSALEKRVRWWQAVWGWEEEEEEEEEEGGRLWCWVCDTCSFPENFI
jgi:hypothetical protein